MRAHEVGTREEWQAARDELAKLEADLAERNEEIRSKRRELPWVPVAKEYEFDTEDGRKSLAISAWPSISLSRRSVFNDW